MLGRCKSLGRRQYRVLECQRDGLAFRSPGTTGTLETRQLIPDISLGFASRETLILPQRIKRSRKASDRFVKENLCELMIYLWIAQLVDNIIPLPLKDQTLGVTLDDQNRVFRVRDRILFGDDVSDL